MRKNKALRLGAVILMVALITACFASSTFARYTSEASGEATAVVAKWSIKYDDTQLAVTGDAPTVEIDLFETINGHSSGDDVDKLAPGTYGSFTFEDILNDSEVDATIKITGVLTNESNVPLQWSTDGETYSTTFPTTLVEEDVDAGDTLDGTAIYWKWDFNGDGSADESDTALGIAAQTAAPEVKVELTINATQID